MQKMEKSTVINTWNESNLHHTLKNIYAGEFNGKTEVKEGPFICDIITEDNSIIEIQTSNISALTKKAEYLIQNKKKITVVHPIIEKKIIETYSTDGTLISKRTSPKSETIYSCLRSLTGICHLLTNPLFTLEIIAVSITEIRRKTPEKVQNTTKSRRHLKDWLPAGKKLNSINSKTKYKTTNDYKNLLPQTIKDSFTPPELYKALLNETWTDGMTKSNKKAAASSYTLLIWLLCKMEIIKKTDEKKGKSWIYKVL